MFIIGFFFLVLTTSGVLSICNQCYVYNTKCISPTQYQFCDSSTGALVSDTIYSCATGVFCNTVNASPCAAGFAPECTCGTCVSGDIKACVSDTQFQVCIDGITPTAPSVSCPAGTKCDGLVPGNFCSADGTSGCAADVVLKCTAAGRYPVPKTLCKQYYLCSYVNSAWMMYHYNCTGTFNFDPSSQKCTSTYSCPVV